MYDVRDWLAGVVDSEPPLKQQIPADYLWKPRRLPQPQPDAVPAPGKPTTTLPLPPIPIPIPIPKPRVALGEIEAPNNRRTMDTDGEGFKRRLRARAADKPPETSPRRARSPKKIAAKKLPMRPQGEQQSDMDIFVDLDATPKAPASGASITAPPFGANIPHLPAPGVPAPPSSPTEKKADEPATSNSSRLTSSRGRSVSPSKGVSKDRTKLRFADPPVETMTVEKSRDLPEAVRPLFTQLKFNANHSSGVVPFEVQAQFKSAPENEDKESEVIEQYISTKKHYLSEEASLEEYLMLKNGREGSAKCKKEGLNEPSWNALVHSPLLRQAVRGLEHVDFYDITRALVIKDLVPNTMHGEKLKQKLIDYAIVLKSPAFSAKTLKAFLGTYEETPALCETVGPSDYGPLQLQPIFINVETKALRGNDEEARVQLYLWVMAHFERLRKLRCVKKVPVIVPLILVVGSSWTALFAVDCAEEIRVYDGVPLGDTSTILGCYRVLKGLRLTIEWARKHFEEWFVETLRLGMQMLGEADDEDD